MDIDIKKDTNPPYLFICFPFAASTIYQIRLSTVILGQIKTIYKCFYAFVSLYHKSTFAGRGKNRTKRKKRKRGKKYVCE